MTASLLCPARELPVDHPDLRRSRCMTLLRVRDGSTVFANSMTGKSALLADIRATDLLLVAWTGRFKTDIFQITHEQLCSKMNQEAA